MGDDPGYDPGDGSIGLMQATSIGIGGMVGGGIFAVLGVAIGKAGGATPLSSLIGGLIGGRSVRQAQVFGGRSAVG